MRTFDFPCRRPLGGFPRRSAPAGANLATAGCIAALALAALTGLGCKVTTDPASAPPNRASEPPPDPVVRDHRTDDAADEASDQTGSDSTDSAESEGGGEPAQGGGAGGERKPLVAKDHKQYAQVEGTSFPNDCETDADCHVGGCSSEICSAEEGVNSTCIMPAEGWVSQGGSCGCVQGSCSWYGGGSGGGGEPADESESKPDRSEKQALAGQGESCSDGKCSGSLTCLKYYGIAGRQGPQFSSCEIPCPRGADQCPDGQTCVTIADGPGQVCRPK